MHKTSLRKIATTLMIMVALMACSPEPTPTPLPSATPTPQPKVMYGPVAPPTVSQGATQSQPANVAPPPTRAVPTAAQLAPTVVIQTQGKPVPPAAGQVAYDFSLSTLEGDSVALSAFRGKKVMLNFWATWCGPCRYEIPHMVVLYDELKDQGFEIVAVNLREDPTKVKAFSEQFEMTFPILLDTQGKIGASYFVRGIPTSVFLNEEGVIEAVHTGTLTDELLRQYVGALMQ